MHLSTKRRIDRRRQIGGLPTALNATFVVPPYFCVLLLVSVDNSCSFTTLNAQGWFPSFLPSFLPSFHPSILPFCLPSTFFLTDVYTLLHPAPARLPCIPPNRVPAVVTPMSTTAGPQRRARPFARQQQRGKLGETKCSSSSSVSSCARETRVLLSDYSRRRRRGHVFDLSTVK
jgi:hypothetical protein